MDKPRRRARSEESKRDRREDILDAAEAVYEKRGFAAFTVAAVATRAAVAKGTLYLYFRTREELLLAVTDRLLSSWFDEIDRPLSRGATHLSPARVAQLLATGIVRRPLLASLLSLVGSVLEHNIDLAAAMRWKWNLLGRVRITAALLARRLGLSSPEAGARLLVQVIALVVGLAQMASPSPVVREALAPLEMAPLRVDFAAELPAALESLIHGARRA